MVTKILQEDVGGRTSFVRSASRAKFDASPFSKLTMGFLSSR